jgi:hypothetical protein
MKTILILDAYLLIAFLYAIAHRQKIAEAFGEGQAAMMSRYPDEETLNKATRMLLIGTTLLIIAGWPCLLILDLLHLLRPRDESR